MTIADALLSFALVAGMLTLIPGLDTTLVLRTTLLMGRARGFAAGVGIAAGLLAWGIAAAVGAAALLAASHTAFLVVKYCGVAYMAYMGLSLILRTFRTHTAAENHSPSPSESTLRAFLQGLGTNLLNPKIGVFYMAMIPQFLPEGVPHLAMGAALAAIHVAFTQIWFALLVLIAGSARKVLTTPRAAKIIDRIAGVLMMGFAGKLATTA